MVTNIKNNTISETDAKKHLNTLNEIKNAEIIKNKKGTPGHKELLHLFNDLLDIILTDKTLESESQEDKNKNETEKVESRIVESRKGENEKVESRKEENENEDENKNMLLEHIEDVDDKLFKKYSQGKDFNSFINEFDHAANKEDKEKIVKEIKRYK